MTAKVINLKRARKGKARQARRDAAAAKTGTRTPGDDAKRDLARHDGHKLPPQRKPDDD